MDKEKVTILVVDDDKIIADVFRDLISSEDKTVNVCYNGEKAIEDIKTNAYDLIITDLSMPKVGGMDVLRYAKKINPDVMVIIVTGYASLESAIMAVREGAYDYIRKPCKLEEIKIVIDNAVEKIRLNRKNSVLTEKLRKAYQELTDAKRKIIDDEKKANVNYFSSNISNLHHLYSADGHNNDYFDRLQSLSALRQNGILNESEFNTFKKQLIKMIDHDQDKP